MQQTAQAAAPTSNRRVSKGRRLLRCQVMVTVAIVGLAGCGGGGSDTPKKSGSPAQNTGGGQPASGKPIQSQPIAHANGPAHIDLMALARTSADKVTARIRVVNDGQRPLPLRDGLRDVGEQVGGLSANGLALLDATGDKIYYPLTTTDGKCLCSNFTGKTAQPGKPLEAYAIFPAPPANVQRITVWAPITAPFVDVPLGSGQVPPAPDQTVDPQQVTLAQPKIRSVISTVEGDEESTDDDDTNRSVRLSADVLFVINKANLTPRAKAVLRRVADQIQNSSGNTVKIDGHTDNSGNDAINNPLSLRRAQSVQSELQRLVTRQGVTYQSAGHGSREPVAKNTTEEGRRQNRRVTVTFTKPKPPSSPPAAPAGSSTAFQWTSGELPVVASGQLTAKNLKVDINSLHRDSTGLVTLVWTVTSQESTPTVIGPAFGKWNSVQYRGNSASGVTLVDGNAKLRYSPLRDQTNACLCTSFIILDSMKILQPNQSVTLSDTYKVPAEVSSVDIGIPFLATTSTIKGVAIK